MLPSSCFCSSSIVSLPTITPDSSKLNNSRFCCFSKEQNASWITYLKRKKSTRKKDIKFKWEYKFRFISTQLSQLVCFSCMEPYLLFSFVYLHWKVRRAYRFRCHWICEYIYQNNTINHRLAHFKMTSLTIKRIHKPWKFKINN